MTLDELKKSYTSSASLLGDYSSMDKTELANGYCDVNEALAKLRKENPISPDIRKLQDKESAYFSALMLRYWYKIFEWMQDSSSLNVSSEEYADWLMDSLQVAFRYRAWRYPYKMKWGKHSHQVEGYVLDEAGQKIANPYYYENDPTAPDKIFNRCIFSARGRAYQFANKLKRKNSNRVLSLDAFAEDCGDAVYFVEEAYEEPQNFDAVSEIIRMLLKKDEVIEALVVDGITHFDTFRKTKTSTEAFDGKSLVRHLNALTPEYITSFCKQYGYTKEITVLPDNSFQDVNNKKIYRRIAKTLQEIKKSPALLNCLL